MDILEIWLSLGLWLLLGLLGTWRAIGFFQTDFPQFHYGNPILEYLPSIFGPVNLFVVLFVFGFGPLKVRYHSHYEMWKAHKERYPNITSPYHESWKV